MEKEGLLGSSDGVVAPLASQVGAQRASITAGSKDLASSCGGVEVGMGALNR